MGDKNKTKKGKAIVFLIVSFLSLAVLDAAIFTYIGALQQPVTVLASVKLNGQAPDITTLLNSYTIYTGWYQEETSNSSVLTNDANKDINVDITTTGADTGITITHDTVGLSTTAANNGAAFANASLNGNVITLEANEHAVDWSDASEARITIEGKDVGVLTLNDFNTMSWGADVINGYLPHVDIIIDTDGDGIEDDALVFEYAKVDPSMCDGSTMPGDGIYPTGNLIATFDNKGDISDSTYAWLNSGPPGPCGEDVSGDLNGDGLIFEDTYKSLSSWKSTYPDANILRLEIEVDAWISNSKSEISNIVINSVSKEIKNLANPVTIKSNSSQVFYINTAFAQTLMAGNYTFNTTINFS